MQLLQKKRFESRGIDIVVVKIIGFGSYFSQIKSKTFFGLILKILLRSQRLPRSAVVPLDSWLNGP